MKNKNWFWGSFFLLSAILVLSSQVGFLNEISILSILATVFFAAIIIYSLIKLNFFGVFIPLSILYMMYSKPLRLVNISPWVLIISALLISIGFSLLIPGNSGKAVCFHEDIKNPKRKYHEMDDNNPYAKVVLSSASKYLHSEFLQSGHFASYLGVLEIYFDQVQSGKDGIELYVDNILGLINLYVPKNWNVTDNTHLYLGDVKYVGEPSKASENAQKIILTGNITMGDVKIYFI